MIRPYFRIGSHMVYRGQVLDKVHYGLWYISPHTEHHILSTVSINEIHKTIAIRRTQGLT